MAGRYEMRELQCQCRELQQCERRPLNCQAGGTQLTRGNEQCAATHLRALLAVDALHRTEVERAQRLLRQLPPCLLLLTHRLQLRRQRLQGGGGTKGTYRSAS